MSKKHLDLLLQICLLLLSRHLIAQNLVYNPGFEANDGKLNAKTELVPGWSRSCLVGLYPTNYAKIEDEIAHGLDPDTYVPYEGKSMAGITYHTRGMGSPVGGGGFVQGVLKETLKRHHYYRISYWVKTKPAPGLDRYGDFTDNFGVSFSSKPFRVNYGHCITINDTPFRYRGANGLEWIQMQYVIRPTRDLSYIAAGVFLDFFRPFRLPENTGHTLYFFIDHLHVTEIEKPSPAELTTAIDYPYLRIRDPLPPIFRSKERIEEVVHFEFGASELTPEAERKLNRLAHALNNDPQLLLDIRGHTDSIGNNNEELSRARAGAVRTYLANRSRLPAYRMRMLGFGSGQAIAGNETESGRQKNRRVEIQQSNRTLSQHLYAIASQFALENKVDSAFLYLARWQKSNPPNQILLMVDPDLDSLRGHRKWKAIDFFTRQTYQYYADPELAFSLDLMYCRMLSGGSRQKYFLAAKGYVPAIKSSDQTVGHMVDTAVVNRVCRILDRGWPVRAQVGERAAVAPIHILLHAGDKNLIKKYLPLVEEAFADNEIPEEAYLTYLNSLKPSG